MNKMSHKILMATLVGSVLVAMVMSETESAEPISLSESIPESEGDLDSYLLINQFKRLIKLKNKLSEAENTIDSAVELFDPEDARRSDMPSTVHNLSVVDRLQREVMILLKKVQELGNYIGDPSNI